jgi:hypothetical protein
MSDDLVAWLREQVTARLKIAQDAAEAAYSSGDGDTSWRFNYQGRPVARIIGAPWESSYGDGIWNCDDPLDDCDEMRLAGTYTGEHIALNDPQDVIARCEAELAILDECDLLLKVGIAFPDEAGPESAAKIVRLIGSGYRHRDGYREEEWKP